MKFQYAYGLVALFALAQAQESAPPPAPTGSYTNPNGTDAVIKKGQIPGDGEHMHKVGDAFVRYGLHQSTYDRISQFVGSSSSRYWSYGMDVEKKEGVHPDAVGQWRFVARIDYTAKQESNHTRFLK